MVAAVDVDAVSTSWFGQRPHILLHVVLGLLIVSDSRAVGLQSAEMHLIESLLQHYNPMGRPVMNQKDVIKVNASFYVKQVSM